MIFKKKRQIKDEKYFEEFLRELSAYEMMLLLKSINKISKEMLDFNKNVKKSKNKLEGYS